MSARKLFYRVFLLASILAVPAHGAIPCVRAITFSSKALPPGGAATGALTLTSAAPAGGLVVQLHSSTAALQAANSVTVAEGKTSASFDIQARSVAADTNATITVSAGDCASVSAAITIHPPFTATPCVSAVTLSTNSIVGGGGLNGTVVLSAPAPANGATVKLQSTSAAVHVNSLVTIPAGQSSSSFSVSTTSVAAGTYATIQASGSGPCGIVSTNLTVNPIASLAAISLSPLRPWPGDGGESVSG
jgi:trimeric autotransporter adhesin